MPAAVQETPNNNAATDRTQQMWKVLKAHILRERARQKQEREAEVEEERLRKEREAREQQDVMTLGETREQISQLETKLTQLKEEKHQLFLQLKKVLNEDDNRRRQLIKESSEQMLAIQTSNMVHQQAMYLQQQQQQNQSRIQQIPQPAQQAPQPPQQQTPPTSFKGAIKRPRSPSPSPQAPVSLYHQGYGYKPQSSVGAGSYQGSPQKDDGRRNELVRAVLWNKTQYSSQPSAFYPVAPPQELSIYYPLSREAAPRNVYENQRPQAFQIDHNKMPEHYPTLRTSTSHAHVIHPGTGLTINPAQPAPKGGSITSGYPVRSQTQQQYQQQPPASLYTAQSRPIYQQNPGGPINYPPRE